MVNYGDKWKPTFNLFRLQSIWWLLVGTLFELTDGPRLIHFSATFWYIRLS